MFSWIDKPAVEQLKSAAGSYIRAALAAVLTLYVSGVTDNQALVNAALASLLAPLIRALDPNNIEYGVTKSPKQ